ncbi:reverse transcriptase domain-containing protein [Pseudomonadota bacterium]
MKITITNASDALDLKAAGKQKKPPLLNSREELANFLGVPHKKLTYILYKLNRAALYHIFEIKKSSGRTRTIHAVAEPLKSLQRKTLERLQEYWKPSAYAHGFTVGKSVITNAAFHRRKRLIIKADIKDFFPSINFGRVQGLFMAQPFDFGEEVATTLAQMACIDDEHGRLPQGGALSPYIANMTCRRLDKRLSRLAQEKRCRYTRYADDVTFSTNDVANLDTQLFLKEVARIVSEEHFEINEEKTKLLTPKDRQIVTGVVVNDGLNVNRKYLRNIRAALRNCAVYGIESQVVRNNGFKDDRCSRVRITRSNGEFYHQNTPLSEEEACNKFLMHLLGKIDFVGQVVRSNGQEENRAKYRRVIAYERLLLKFLELVERKSAFRDIERRVLKRINTLPGLQDSLNARQERKRIRVQIHEEHLVRTKTIEQLNVVDSVASLPEMRKFVRDLSKSDPRFFPPTLPSNLNDARARLRSLLIWPAIDKEKTFHLLESLKGSETDLSVLVHPLGPLSDGLTAERGFALLAEHFDSVAYYIPKALRDSFDEYARALEEYANQNGRHKKFDPMKDPLISDATSKLKNATRFGINPAEDRTLAPTIKKAIAHARSLCKNRKDIEIPDPDVESTTGIYTHVGSVEDALERILHSMLKNTLGSKIEITAKSVENDNKFEILVTDDWAGTVPGNPSRKFAHGKLGQVVRRANGLFDYYVEASFEKGGRACIDMLTGEVVDAGAITDKGFAHRLRFEIS